MKFSQLSTVGLIVLHVTILDNNTFDKLLIVLMLSSITGLLRV